MPANMGMARRMEAANRRIDAAVAALSPESHPPSAHRNRGFAEVARAEWLADTLEALAAQGTDDTFGGDDLRDMSIQELRDRAASLEVEGRSGMNKAALIAAIRAAQDEG